MLADRYYYHILDNKNQEIYKIIYAGIAKSDEKIELRNFHWLNTETINEIYEYILLDSPQFYYINPSSVEIQHRSDGTYFVLPTYSISKEELAKYNALVEKYIIKILDRAKVTESSEWDLVKNIHDVLVTNIEYDKENLDAEPNSMEYLYAHSILGGLFKRKAVCDGIAKLFKYLLNVAEIKCIVVYGEGTSEYSIGDNSNHAWNIVKVNNSAYHIDITWDLSGSEKDNISYDYYCLSDDMIQIDHTYKLKYPACKEVTQNYFEKNKLIIRSEIELQRFITNQLKSVPKRVYCKVNYDDSYDNILNKAQNFAIKEAIKYKNIVKIKGSNKAQKSIIDFWVL